MLGLSILSLTFSNNNDINESENVIKKKTKAFSIPIFIISEKGLAFLLSKYAIKERKRKAIVMKINKSLISMCITDPGTEMKIL